MKRVKQKTLHSRAQWISLTLALAALAPDALLAQSATSRDLIKTNLEDLMNMEVTSVSKKEQKMSHAAAAVYVITQEDIRRSGALSIPDLLRMAPGVDVAQIDSNTWAISIRGFNERYSNKVLVLIDGRSAYTPAFSGVFWDQLDVPMETIERIEVIRGPGGTVWGANAVNGVINIITRNAKATPGALFSAASGSNHASGLLQFGDRIGPKGAYRAFGRYFNIGNSATPQGGQASDGRHGFHGGFRADWDLSLRDTMTVQGDFSEMNERQTISVVNSNALPTLRTFTDKLTLEAGNVLARWNHSLAIGSNMSLQVYYDAYHRVDGGLDSAVHTGDVDFDHHLAIGSRQDLVWGVGYRVTGDRLSPGVATLFVPTRRIDSLFSAFVQDEIRVTDSVSMTVGSKFEHNAYTGFEYEPSAQLIWSATDRQAFWVSAARAIRQPSRSDAGLQVDAATFPVNGGATFGLLKVLGSPHPQAEQLRDYEAGYRAQVSKRLSLDVAGFASFYRRLQTSEPHDPYFTVTPGPPHLVFPNVFEYKAHARTHGAELFANWNVTNRWRISPGYTLLHMAVDRDPSSRDSAIEQTPGESPKRQYQIRSLLNLRRNLDWDNRIAYVGRLTNGDIPGYVRLDTRLGWRLGESVECSIVGQNLLRPLHSEFHDAYQLQHSQIERSVYGSIKWRF